MDAALPVVVISSRAHELTPAQRQVLSESASRPGPEPEPKPDVRIDTTDGEAYPLDSFIAVYGGSRAGPPQEWRDAARPPPAQDAGPVEGLAGSEGELRVDATDGASYPLQSFMEVYGGSVTAPPQEWVDARRLESTAPAPVPSPGAGSAVQVLTMPEYVPVRTHRQSVPAWPRAVPTHG